MPVEMILIPHNKGVPRCNRASEGSAIQLNDGRILYVYTHYYYQTGHDIDACELRGLISSDAGGEQWGEPFVVQANDARINTMIVSLIRLGTAGKTDLKAVQSGSDDVLAGTEGGALGMLYVKHETKHTNGIHFRLSRDEGLSWSREVRINSIPTYSNLTMNNDSAIVLSSGRILVPVQASFGGVYGSYVYYSDDEGSSWNRCDDEMLLKQTVNRSDGASRVLGYTHFEEPNLVELKDGQVLMIGRNITGRMWTSTSADQGETWCDPKPTDIATSYSPVSIRRIPSSQDLLLIWNHASPDEIASGWGRMRMSCAVSRDDGKSWDHFKNLESLNDVGYIRPTQVGAAYDVMSEIAAIASRMRGVDRDPPDLQVYPRASAGYWHVDYPSLTFLRDDRALITYGVYGGAPEMPIENTGCKLRILPVSWFYQ